MIRRIVEEVLNQSVLENYSFYLLMLALALVSAAGSAFLTSYYQKRGENFATKADFENILEQLEETTRLSEEIKADIEAKYQEEAGRKYLLREKLELLMSETYELEAWLEQARSNAFNKELPNTNESPLAKMEMYQTIYFPELKNELIVLKGAYFPMIDFILDTAALALKGEAQDVGKFKEIHKPVLDSLSGLRESLIGKCANKIGL
jgi:hypothetical protein